MDRNKNAYEQLKNGISNYINEIVDKIGYDKTYSAIVKEVTNNGYTISLNNVLYYNVYTIGGTCTENEIVKVVIPQNNYNNMFILKGGTNGSSVGEVISVNGKKGVVTLDNEDVGALSSNYKTKIDLWDLIVNDDGSVKLVYNG